MPVPTDFINDDANHRALDAEYFNALGAEINVTSEAIGNAAAAIGEPSDPEDAAGPSLFGMIKYIVARFTGFWTDARAAFLDVAVSSRAPASTALSNAKWTDAMATGLGALTAGPYGGFWARYGAQTATFSVPAGVTTIYITAWGAGGGGYIENGGGGGNAIIRYPYTVTAGSNISITIGAGGNGGKSARATDAPVNTAATAGGNTVIGSLVTLNGGGAGTDSAPGAAGGTGGGVGGRGLSSGAAGISGLGGATSGVSNQYGTSPGGGGGSFGNGGHSSGNTVGDGGSGTLGGGGGAMKNATGAGITNNGGKGGTGGAIIEW